MTFLRLQSKVERSREVKLRARSCPWALATLSLMKEGCLGKLQPGSGEWTAEGGTLGSNESLTMGEW